MKESTNDKSIYEISTRDLFKDFLNALTDIEKRLFHTLKELYVSPEKVIYGYIGPDRNHYTSAFRYLLLTIFLSYLNFEFFYEPRVIDGAFYNVIADGIKTGIADKPGYTFDKKAFDIFFLEYTRILTLFYKFTSCFSIPALFFSFWIFFKGLKFNFACRLVASTLMASQITITALLMTPVFNFTVDNLMWVSYLLHIPMFLYTCYAMYRIGKRHYKKLLLRSFLAGLFATVIFSATNITYGIGLFSYLKGKTPEFVIKPEKKPMNSPTEKSINNGSSIKPPNR